VVVSRRVSNPTLAAKASPTSSEISVALSARTVPLMRKRSRVGTVPTRTLPLVRRLRPVGLDDGVVTHASVSCSSRFRAYCLRCC
jgi:hypothetical protein